MDVEVQGGGCVLEGIRQIGKAYQEKLGVEKGFVFSLVQELVRGEEKRYLLEMDFKIQGGYIELAFPEIDSRVGEEYLWVGNCKGNIPQDRLTTDRLEYLFFDSLVNLNKKLQNGALKGEISALVQEFFLTRVVKGKTVYLLDFRKIRGFPQNLSLLELDDLKKLRKEYVKAFFKVLQEKKGFKEGDFGLFSVTIEGKKPSEMEEYITYLERSIVEESFEEAFEGTCYVCGKRDLLTCDTARFPDKFYITKLITFSAGLAGKERGGGFSKNFSLCRECYKDLVAGMRYLRNYLGAFLAGNTIYLIPGFFFHSPGKSLTEKWMELSRRYVVSTFRLEDFVEFERRVEQELEDYRTFEELIDLGYVDILFYLQPPGRASFKIRKLIREVPLRRIREIREALRDIQRLGEELLGENEGWFLSLQGISYLLPVRSGREEEHRKILEVYENIFLGYPVERRILIRFFLTLAQVYRFERQDYSVKPRGNTEIALVQAILRTQLLLKLFERLALIERGDGVVELWPGMLNEEMEQYIRKMGYSEAEAALFLLGYLIGEIGAEQVWGGDWNAKKPILNKINFNGMSAKNLLLLAGEIFEKLDQYRIRGYNEKIFAVMKSLLDAHIKDWPLSDAENVYYILSGYAFHTYRMVTGARKKEEAP